MSVRTIEAPFARGEYEARVARVKERMEEQEVDVLVSSDPSHMTYLTGYNAQSYYVPQAVVVVRSLEQPLWFSRGLDEGCALVTTYLDAENLIGYGEKYIVDRVNRHPMTFLAQALLERGLGEGRIATEEDGFCISPRGLAALRAGLPKATFVDAGLLVNWVRTVKSDAEIALMREIGKITNAAIDTASKAIRPGVRECDAAAEIYQALVRGTAEMGGHEALHLCIPSGQKTTTPHLVWTDVPYQDGTSVNVEIGGSRDRYHVPIARTVHLGTPPDHLKRLAEVTIAGYEAMLERIGPGATCHEVATAFNDHIRRFGYDKEERCGYSLGIGYPPSAWVENTISLAVGDQTQLERNMTLHVLAGMWLENQGFVLSETVAVTDSGYELLSRYARDLLVH